MISSLPPSLIESARKIINGDKKSYVGNCVDSFDSDTGDIVNPHVNYRDTSHFSDSVEDFKTGNTLDSIKISKDEFLNNVNVPPHLNKLLSNKDTEYLHDKENDQHMMYDPKKDVHHFFS